MFVVERGEGTPIILIHGFGVDHRLLLPLDDAIAAAGTWRRIYLDLPGHGGTPVDGVASAEDVVAAVETEIGRRVGADPFAVLGSSFGGMIARRVAHDLRDQVLGLALLAPLFVADRTRRDLPPRTVLVEDASALRSLGESGADYAEMAVVQSHEGAQLFLEHVWPGLSVADREGLERIAARYALDQAPEDTSPEPFTRPVLFVTGRQDAVVGYRDAWARMEHYPRATFATLDAAGHNVHLEQAMVTVALLTDWLRRVRADGPRPPCGRRAGS